MCKIASLQGCQIDNEVRRVTRNVLELKGQKIVELKRQNVSFERIGKPLLTIMLKRREESISVTCCSSR